MEWLLYHSHCFCYARLFLLFLYHLLDYCFVLLFLDPVPVLVPDPFQRKTDPVQRKTDPFRRKKTWLSFVPVLVPDPFLDPFLDLFLDHHQLKRYEKP